MPLPPFSGQGTAGSLLFEVVIWAAEELDQAAEELNWAVEELDT